MQTKRELGRKRTRKGKELHLTITDEINAQLQEIISTEQISKSGLFRKMLNNYYKMEFKKNKEESCSP
jgi:hypothetical protein